MLVMPFDSRSTFTVTGIDPGSNSLGVSTFYLDVDSLQIVKSEAMTYVGANLGKNTFHTKLHGDRIGRIHGHKENLLRYFELERPFLIASEAPFVSRAHPLAGLVLTEVIEAIRSAMYEYDKSKDIYLIDPPTVKNAVGAAGNAPKEKVREKVMQLPDLNYQGVIPLALLDEHGLDSLAVGYCLVTRLRNLRNSHV